MRISRLHHPVTVLGHGRRAGIWTQGCSIRCVGCISRDTWDVDPDGADDVAPADLVAWVAQRASQLDGVTISGGEPFDQPEELADLLAGLGRIAAEVEQPFDLLCFSGYSYAVLARSHQGLLAGLDTVVTGPFVQHRAAALSLRGSANQVITTLTALGTERYAGAEDPAGGTVKRIQVAADGDGLWYIGIPAPGDMDRLDNMMRARGVVQQGVSWRP